MNKMVSNEQFQEFMNELHAHNQRMESLIMEQGRKVDALLKEVQLTHALVYSVYKDGETIKMGGAR